MTGSVWLVGDAGGREVLRSISCPTMSYDHSLYLCLRPRVPPTLPDMTAAITAIATRIHRTRYFDLEFLAGDGTSASCHASLPVEEGLG